MSTCNYWGDFKAIADDPGNRIITANLFSSEMVRDYDQIFPVQDADVYQGLATDYPGPILELGCGTGRILATLVEQGHCVTGIDLSQAALDVAAERLESFGQTGGRGTLIAGDITTFDLGQSFPLIIFPACSITLFPSPSERKKIFERVAAHLGSDGTFVFDFPLFDWSQQADWSAQIFDLQVVRANQTRRVRLGMKAHPSAESLSINIHWPPTEADDPTVHHLESRTMAVIDAAQIEQELAEAGLVVSRRETARLPQGASRIRWLHCRKMAAPHGTGLVYPHMPLALSTPHTTLAAGKGATVTDTQGKDYIDLASGLWSTQCGQAHPDILHAITQQLQTLSYGTLFAGYSNHPAQELSQRLLQIVGPRFGRCALTNSGSESVELAVKLARSYWRSLGQTHKFGIAHFDHSYHGTFFASMALSGLHDGHAQASPGVAGIHAVPAPLPRLCPQGCSLVEFESACLDRFEATICAPTHSIGAFIFEPVLGSAGAVVPSASFWQRLQRLCREHDVLLIADEVATGFGRCGDWLASPSLGISPDVVLLSKGISSGYLPLGAVLFSQQIATAIERAGMGLGHGSSHNGNPACCAAGLATIRVIETENLCRQATQIGEKMRAHLTPLLGQSSLRRLHGIGAFLGCELQQTDGSEATAQQIALLLHILRDLGVLAYPAPSGLVLLPPLMIEDDTLDNALNRLKAVLSGLRLENAEVSHVRAG